MFLLIEDDNETVFINIDNIAEVHYDSITEVLLISYIGNNEESEFERNNALKIHNYLKSKAILP